MSYSFFVSDAVGSIQGQLDLFTKATLVLRYCGISSWSIEMVDNTMGWELSEPGAWLVVYRGDDFLLQGPVTEFVQRADLESSSIVVSGVSEDCILWDRICWPGDYASNAFDAAYDTRTGAAETVMKGFVTANAAAKAHILVPGVADDVVAVTVATDAERGPTRTVSARFEILGDLLTEIAAGAALGFHVRQGVFDVFEPVDRSDLVSLSIQTGNVLSYELTRKIHTSNQVVAGGQGEGDARVIAVETASADPWLRVREQFLDRRDVDDLAVLTTAAATEVTANAEEIRVSLEPIDTPTRSFGVDYNLGDKIRVENIVGVVSDVTVTVDENGVTTAPAVNSSEKPVLRSAQTAFASFRSGVDLAEFRRRMQVLQQ